jgi:hypothetical protein
MNRFHIIGRLAVILAGLARALLAFCTDAAPAAAVAATPAGTATLATAGPHRRRA